MHLPQSLREGVIAWEPDGQDWADALPVLVQHCSELWGLTVGEPFEGGYVAWVAPAERADGSPCVLKLSYPGPESRQEPDALRLWDGAGAVHLLDEDASTGALLLERVQPGTSLFDVADPEEAMTIACDVLRRLWTPLAEGHPFALARDSAVAWAEETERRHATEGGSLFDRGLLDAAIAAFAEVAVHDGEAVVLHQDFHRGNVLRAQREPWLAIDPKPLAGERAFDARWLLYDLLYREPRNALPPAELLARLSTELALDAERVRLWTLARAVENALWCYEVGEAAPDDVALAAALA